MKTVIICEKAVMEQFDEYKVFLKPLFSGSNVSFCEWNIGNKSMEDTLMRLDAIVGREPHWRALVVCPDDRINQKNPFDYVNMKNLSRSDGREDISHEEKLCAYETAKDNPIVRLTTHLCEMPFTKLKADVSLGYFQTEETEKDTVDEDIYVSEEDTALENEEWKAYKEESEKKQEIRREIRNECQLKCSLPEEVYLLAQRTCENDESTAADLHNAWTEYTDFQYSRFYDWNLYFDKLRYMIYDISDPGQSDYQYQFLCYLYTLLIFSRAEVPQGAVKPNKVYRLNCVDNEMALKDLLAVYAQKLDRTKGRIAKLIDDQEKVREIEQSNKEIERNYLISNNVNLVIDEDREAIKDLYAKQGDYGLTKDCPTEDEVTWANMVRVAKKSLARYLKQPRRALGQGVTELKRISQIDTSEIKKINDFQMDDIRNYAEDEELRMVSVHTPELYDLSLYEEKLDEESALVRAEMKLRMSRKKAILFSVVAAVSFMISFCPMLFFYFFAKEVNVPSVLITLAGVLAVLLAAVLGMVIIRMRFGKKIKKYNREMKSIELEISDSLNSFSEYLTHAGNMSRSQQVLEYSEKHRSPKEDIISVYEKHMGDLIEAEDRFQRVFGQFLCDLPEVEISRADAYEYDFSKAVDYIYNLPLSSDTAKKVLFLQAGSYVDLPLNIIDGIEMKLEEMYV